MTDIQHHLKGIRKLLSTFILQPYAPEDQYDQIRRALRTLLPHSYGIGSGRIIGKNGATTAAPLLIYDVPLSNGNYTEETTEFKIEHVLLVAYAALNHTIDTLRQTFDAIARIKQLQDFRQREPRPSAPSGQTRRIIPKDRLPFALVYFLRFGAYTSHELGLYNQLISLMDNYPVAQLPDQIDIIEQHAQYLNPLLELDNPQWFDLGWTRTSARRDTEFCYTCKQKFLRRHFFYDRLCLRCGDLNYRKRLQSADLSGYRVLVTGARIKIGYNTALKLLRAGAEVIATSRFPRNTAVRYAQEPDFDQWRMRLHIYGIDLRQTPRLESFTQHLNQTYPYLDAIINNAAQTIKRPVAYYAHLLPAEMMPLNTIAEPLQLLLHDPLVSDHLQTLVAGYLPSGEDALFPSGVYDEHGQQIDNRDINTWVMPLESVSPAELVEVHLINAIAPAILAAQLKPMLMRSPHASRFIINVSAAEGRFTQAKTGKHPHTNMAKAALNMLTRSIADDYARDQIYVSSIDPGWISDQMPRQDETSRQQAVKLPIDLEDAASRLCDPIFSTVRGEHPSFGKLLKDYEIVSW